MDQDKNQAGDQYQPYTNIQSGGDTKNSTSLTDDSSTQESSAQSSSYEGSKTLSGRDDNNQEGDDRKKTLIYAVVIFLLTVSAVVLAVRIYSLWKQRGGESQRMIPSSVDQDNNVRREDASPVQNQEPEEVIEEVMEEVDNLDLDELDAVDKQIEQDMNQL